jgi:hypothetical protein
MEFKKNIEIFTDDFWYDVFEGGYIKPEKLLKNESDVVQINKAIKILNTFKTELEKQNIIQEM